MTDAATETVTETETTTEPVKKPRKKRVVSAEAKAKTVKKNLAKLDEKAARAARKFEAKKASYLGSLDPEVRALVEPEQTDS